MKKKFRKYIFYPLLILFIVCCCLSTIDFVTAENITEQSSLSGKKISILGDSISTYIDVSNNILDNTTIGSNVVYYTQGRYGVYREDTWWQQTIDALGMRLLVNNSWSGSCVLQTRMGTKGAYINRCVQLHNDITEETPDIIVVFLGTNDFSYYQDSLGTSSIDYDTLLTKNGYADPKTTCEAYAIMLDKMINRYPDTEIYCFSLLPRRDPDYDRKDIVPSPTLFNKELKTIIEHFHCHYVEIGNIFSEKATEFDKYIADHRVHPNALGMDKITEALLSVMRQQQEEKEALCGTAKQDIEIIQQPTNSKAKIGEKYYVTVKAKGDGLTYRWYGRNEDHTNWFKTCVTGNTYSHVMNSARAGREVYCVIQDMYGNSVISDIARLILSPKTELKIVTQPTNGEAKIGEKYCVTVTVEGDGLKYRWYGRNAGQTNWFKTCVTENTYCHVMTSARENRELYCLITDIYGNQKKTDIIKLIRIPETLQIIEQPMDTIVSLGEIFRVPIKVKGDNLQYQWYYRKKGSSRWIQSKIRTNVYEGVMKTYRNDREVYCQIMDKWGNTVTTNVVSIHL